MAPALPGLTLKKNPGALPAAVPMAPSPLPLISHATGRSGAIATSSNSKNLHLAGGKLGAELVCLLGVFDWVSVAMGNQLSVLCCCLLCLLLEPGNGLGSRHMLGFLPCRLAINCAEPLHDSGREAGQQRAARTTRKLNVTPTCVVREREEDGHELCYRWL